MNDAIREVLAEMRDLAYVCTRADVGAWADRIEAALSAEPAAPPDSADIRGTMALTAEWLGFDDEAAAIIREQQTKIVELENENARVLGGLAHVSGFIGDDRCLGVDARRTLREVQDKIRALYRD